MPGNPNILSNSATPEMMGPREGLPAFFGWAEKTHPQGVKELVGVIGSLMPEGGEAATEQGIRDGLTNSKLDMGFNVLSSWLTDVGAGGFRDINGAMRWGFLQAAKANKIRFPAKEKVSGREAQAVLKSFSATMKNAEAGGMRPTQIVGNLLQESVGSRLTNNGSGVLRAELVKALGGEQNLTWLWMPLGIRDAAGQTGFKPVAAEPKPVATAQPLPEAAIIRREKAETEKDPTLEEKVFIETLEGLVGMEKSTGTFEAKGLRQLERRQLQQYFQDMKSYFSRLPEAGQLRAEVMRNVNNQLGAEAERLKKAGKSETEIFDEWLKQVFIPLYRRVGKGK